MVESLEEFGIEVNKNMLLALDECKNQEEIDSFFDDYFKRKWLSCERDIKNYKFQCIEWKLNVYYIGNGIQGYEYQGKRFITIEEAEEYIEG